jgi:galactoside O-acetyltransferase
LSARHSLTRAIAELRFNLAGAHIEVGRQAQIRSLAVRPRKGGLLKIGDGSIFAGRLAMDRDNAIIGVGPRSFVGKGLLVAAKSIDIGADVLLSWGVTIVDHQSHSIDFADRAGDVASWLNAKKDWSMVEIAPVRICDKVWVGFGVSILPGVTVGEGAVVGAASVVTRDVEPWTVVAGNPAKVVKRLDLPV